MKVYISGPIRSCMNVYKHRFERVQKRLEANGHIVINPATLPIGLDEDKYMPICMAMIDAADAIYLFGDWRNSRGAMLEKAYAEYQQKAILFDD